MVTASPPRSTTRHVLVQAGWAGALDLVGIGLRYGLLLAVARLLGPAGLGIYVLATAFASGAALLGRMGLNQAAVRFTAMYRTTKDGAGTLGIAIFSSAATSILATALAASLFLLGPALGHIWHQPGLAAALQVIAIGVPAMALGQVWRDGLRGFHDVRLASALEQVAIPGSALVLLLGWTSFVPHYPMAAIAAYVGANWLAACAAAIALGRQLRPLATEPRYHPGEWMSFAAFLSLEGGLLYLLGWSDQLLIGVFLAAKDVGIYAAAVRLAALVAVPLLAVNTILGPTIAGLSGTGQRTKLHEVYSRFTWATAMGGAVIASGLLLAGSSLLALFGDAFEAALPALTILAISQFVNAATGSSGLMLGMTGHVRLRLANAALTAALNVSLNWALIPRWGIVGSAVATGLALTTINLLQVAEVRVALGFWGYDLRQLMFWVERGRRILKTGSRA